jgi:hypothetical protein
VRSAASVGLAPLAPTRGLGSVGRRRLWRAPSRILAARSPWPTIPIPQSGVTSG